VKAVEGPEVAINIAVPTMPAKTPTEILRENMVTSGDHARSSPSSLHRHCSELARLDRSEAPRNGRSHPTAAIWRSTVRTVVGTFRILRGAGSPWSARTPRPASQRLYLVAQLTTAIALASWHTAPVIPSMRRAALSPVQ
jgi:hypothetical protein